ncbi:hypothetical protein [Luteolibacter marinus]|uniref:hypothetical protein n=1 Tax=Luteolibacter marinus TaxID=2776705 RepID=UPI001868D862|nr:hypothetical protein [Luteolibacter marinus]
MTDDPPSANRALGWYRFVLWCLPWSVAVITWIGVAWLGAKFRGLEQLLSGVWLMGNLAATVGIGALDDRVKSSLLRETRPVNRANVANFVFVQILLVPWFVMAILFSVCALVGSLF